MADDFPIQERSLQFMGRRIAARFLDAFDHSLAGKVLGMLARGSALLESAGNALIKRNTAVIYYLASVTLGYLALQYVYNPSIFYNGIGWLDPFMYVGYGLYYSYPDFLNGYYKVSRLPWDLLEFIARHSLNPRSAAFFLQSFCSCLMSVSVFFYFRRLISGSNALLLAILSIFFPLFHADGGADYHNAISGALYFLLLALLIAAIAERSLLFAAWSGVAAAVALHTNPLIALLAPGLALHCLALCRSHRRDAVFIFSALVVSIAGLTAGTLALSAISAAFGRGFLFFMPQLDYLREVRATNTQWDLLTWETFVASKSNAYLIGIFIICFVELVVLAVARRIRDEQQAATAYAGYIVSYLLAVAWQIQGQGILKPDYMEHMFVVATFVPLGYLMQRYLPPLSTWGLAILSIALPVASAFVLIGSSQIYQVLGLEVVSPLTLVLLILAGTYLALVAFRATRLNLSIVLLPTLLVAVIQYSEVYAYDSCRYVEDLNIFIDDASIFITKIAGNPQRAYLIADPNENMTAPCFKKFKVVNLAASLSEVGHEFIGDMWTPHQLEQLTRDDFAGVVHEDGIVGLLVANDANKDRFVQTTANLGLDLHLAGLFPDPASGVTLYLFRLGSQSPP